jgi:ABC-type lipoprotein release transport system permease subunit
METLKLLAPLAWRNLWRNPRRTVITLFVVSVGLWSILAMASFITAWAQSSRDATLRLLIAQGQIHAEGYLDNPNINRLMAQPEGALLKALNQPEISNWVTRLELPAVVQSEYKTLPVSVIGVLPEGELRISSVPKKLVEGRYLNGPEDDGAIIGLNLAKRLKTALGRRVILMITAEDGWLEERSFDVVGIYDADTAFEDSYIFTGQAAMQAMVGLDTQISQIAFEVPDDLALEGVVTSLRLAAPSLDIRQWRKLSLIMGAMDATMGAVVYIWMSVMMVMISIGVINTQLMAVFERTHEFGLLRALGLKPSHVLVLVTLESILLIGLAVLIGMAMGAATVWGLSNGIDLSAFSRALEAFKAGEVLYLKIKPIDYVVFPLAIWVLGVLVALWPAWRAAKIAPVEAMRHAT